ncbi:hypothetical protein GCM10010293_62040 [Streptomyces griseoflavus]|nr:hypothetical protein GCM10010293_62040 [Streptomyces griseoflavus]
MYDTFEETAIRLTVRYTRLSDTAPFPSRSRLHLVHHGGTAAQGRGPALSPPPRKAAGARRLADTGRQGTSHQRERAPKQAMRVEDIRRAND